MLKNQQQNQSIRILNLLKPIAAGLLLVGLQGCFGCDSTPINEPGSRSKTSMAGQPEEYMEATRLDAKEDTSLTPTTGQSEDSVAAVDTFEILTDQPVDSTGTDEPNTESGPQ